jgi:hypothetical protein
VVSYLFVRLVKPSVTKYFKYNSIKNYIKSLSALAKKIRERLIKKAIEVTVLEQNQRTVISSIEYNIIR